MPSSTTSRTPLTIGSRTLGSTSRRVYNNGRGPDHAPGACLGMVGTETELARHGHVQRVDRRLPSPRGQIAPGAGWRLRKDERYQNPTPLETFFKENHEFVKQKLQRAEVDEDWFTMAREIAEDVRIGRMEGPFESPLEWPKRTVGVPQFQHTSELLPFPKGQVAVSFDLRSTRQGPTTSRR